MARLVKVVGHKDNWDIWFSSAKVSAVSCDRGKSTLHVYTVGSDDPFVFNFDDEVSRDASAKEFMHKVNLCGM